MTDKILFVDDEPNVLSSIRRSLRNRFSLDFASGGDEALRKIKLNGGYAVIVSDMRMPGMSGVEFLAEAKKLAPNTIRMMLTGNADQQTAVDAVNVGDVFRFLNKPCQTEELGSAVSQALRQYQLVTAEKELLEQTLRGSIKALTDILALNNPEVFGRATRLRSHVRRIARQMKLAEVWKHESAALLSQIGCTAIPEDLVKRQIGGHRLDRDERAVFAGHARVGAELVSAIPRLEEVAQAIRYQEKHFDGGGFPEDAVAGGEIPLGARILKVALDFDVLESAGTEEEGILPRLREMAGRYDPEILAAFEASLKLDANLEMVTVDVVKLTDSMVLAEDVRTANDLLLVAKGQETTLSVRRRLQTFFENGAIAGAVRVWAKS